MRTSLIIPNYNHAAYLPASVGALLAQTRPADEIIIIDDASTDDSLDVIERLTAGRADVRVVRLAERGGVVKALNAGLELATGDVIAFLGADDRVFPEFLATMVPMLEAHPEAAFGCGRVELRDESGRRTGERPIVRPTAFARYMRPADMRRQLRHADNFFLGQVTLYRTACLRELGGFDATLGSLSDSMLQRRLAVRWGYVFVPEILGIWRLHGANYSVSSVMDPGVLEQMIADGRGVLANEPAGLYPPRYLELFERRLRFNSARLLAARLPQSAISASLIGQILGGGRIDQAMLAGVVKLGPLAPHLATAWITVRLRPFALSWLLSEAAWRAVDRLRPARKPDQPTGPP